MELSEIASQKCYWNKSKWVLGSGTVHKLSKHVYFGLDSVITFHNCSDTYLLFVYLVACLLVCLFIRLFVVSYFNHKAVIPLANVKRPYNGDSMLWLFYTFVNYTTDLLRWCHFKCNARIHQCTICVCVCAHARVLLYYASTSNVARRDQRKHEKSSGLLHGKYERGLSTHTKGRKSELVRM